MNREGKKCVLYPRVSTEMQVDGYSLEGQKNGLKRFADREEMEIVGIYEDAGKSGKSIEGRPAFKKMLSDIGNGLEIDYILVYKLSRFGRNAADILNSLEYVQSYGVNLICIEEGIDSSQTSGKLLISVLSAVAEIERENIIEQTMNGRREKARQGGWNGGFAPYGYYLKDNQLLIEESEAAAIRIIFEKFAGSDIGYGGIAKYLNLQGIKKIPRQNGTLENWSGHLVRQILDNPVYCGKIAYGRRTREKVKGTKNEYKQVHAEDYILEDGQHEGIVSEELWQKVHAKRVATGIKQPSKTGKDRSHLLTGVLKCPLCGSPMYTNKHAWTNKDGTYKEVYYYICGRNKQERGHYCEYKASLRKTDIEPLVIEAIRELVSDKSFAKEIKKRFGVQTDTSKIDKELANYESKLKEVDLNKARLEREIDNLPADAKYRERKIHDMTIRLDGLYDTIVELEERIEDAKLRRSSIEMEAITLENVYRIMENFSKLYAIISDEEKKSLVSYLIKEIQIYPNGTSDRILKSIEFNFPIYRDGREIRKLLWENGNTVETCTVCGEKQSTPTHVQWVEGQYKSSVLTKPTCTINGVQIDTCQICGQRRTVSIPANGEHVWQQTSRTEPKCTTTGTIYYKCQNCNATKSETIPALGHNNVVQTEVKPTCTAAGYIIYRCSTCGATTRVENSATGHTPADDSYVITVEPTCTKGGAATATCATCGEAYDIVLDALGHNYVNLDTAIDGHTDLVDRKVICSRCQDLKSENEKYHLEWVDGNYTTETIVAGNCTTSAIYKDTCTFCGATRNRTVEATGAHNYSYSGYDANSAKLTYTCSICNDVKSYNPTFVLAAWNVNNVNKKAADVTNGYLFELSGDGIINAKDYALIKQAVAKKSSKN